MLIWRTTTIITLMPRAKQPVNSTPSKQPSKRTASFATIALAIGLVVLLFLQLNDLRTAASYKKHSVYKDIETRFVNDTQNSVKSRREYPITQNNTVNTFLAEQIDDLRKGNSRQTKGSTVNENISYNISYNKNQILSIKINAIQKTSSAGPVVTTRQQTFDLKTGDTIKVEQLFKNTNGFEQVLLPNLRRAVAEQIKLLYPDFDNSAKLHQTINRETVTDFMIEDNQFIFEIKPAISDTLAVSSLNIKLLIEDYYSAIKPDILERIFDESLAKNPHPESPKNQASFCAQHPCVALTFDDGPSPQTTNRLLDILQQNNVKATFFVLGDNAARYPEILQRQVNDGHQIGNHSRRHKSFNRLSNDELSDEINYTNQIVKDATGYTPSLTRPPYGDFNQRVFDKLNELNQATVLWSVDTRDWEMRNSELIYNRAIASAEHGSIILFHDIHATTIDAIDPIIKELKARGFYLVTVDTLFGGSLPTGGIYRGR